MKFKILPILMVALVLSACGGSSGDTKSSSSASQGASAASEPVTLTINTFGDFGYADLLKKYHELHPNVTVKENKTEYNAHHQALQLHLQAGSGAGDIEAIDEGFVLQFRNQASKFHNLDDLGAQSIKARWLPWKWAATESADGKTQIGLGTDVGGLAMCYRKDLFAKAGLPTDREAVSKLWPTWDAYINAGKDFVAKSGGVKWVDAATNIMNPVLAQQPVGYFDTSDQLAMTSQPGVKAAWDTSMSVISNKLSANLTAFSPDWNTGFKQGSFATIACPAWMLGYIQGQAPATAGKWDIATIPGGGGNWGGSFLVLPKQGKHPKEAYELAAWLTDPAQTLQIFEKVGNLPSQVDLFTNAQVLASTNKFFSGAPVGKIFIATAQQLKPQYLGTKNGPVRQAVEANITLVQQGKLTPDAAWQKALADAQTAAG